MKKLKNITVGDVFAVKIEGTDYHYFGRVLFDVKEQYTVSRENDNYLDWFGKSVLIETYKSISKKTEIYDYNIAINSVFIPKKDLLNEELIILEKKEVNPKKVSFPKVFKNVHKKGILFATGELALKTSFNTEYVDNNAKVFPSSGNIYNIQSATLDYSGKRELIEDEEDIMDDYFKWSNLESHPNTLTDIYKDINEDINLTYYELALKYGYDLARLY